MTISATRRDRRLTGRALTAARMAGAGLAVFGTVAFVASLPAAYHRIATLDPFLVEHPQQVRAGLAAWGISVTAYALGWLTVLSLVAAVFVGVGVLILLRRPDDRAALLFAGVLIAFGVIWPNTLPVPGWPAPLAAATGLLVDVGFVGFFGLLFYFPDGRFVPSWTRWAFVALGAHVIVSESLLRFGIRLPDALDTAAVLAWLGTGVWAQVHRYRHVSTAAQRQQTKWAAAALVTAMVGFVLTPTLQYLPVFSRSAPGAVIYSGIELLTFGALFCLVPLAIARAVLRHRLWDIDPLLHRALVYGGLTAALTAVYAGIVTWVGRGVTVQGYPVASFAAAGAVAVLFEPLRRRLQRWANRLTYGQRDDPYAAVTTLARRIADTAGLDDVLPLLARSARRAMRSPYAAIAAADGAVLADSGRAVPQPITIPLVQHAERVGLLLIAPRMAGEGFDVRDTKLLADLARQIAAAVLAVRLHQRAARLTADLVTAREEERRRVRRDLHDGLGPTLAAQVLQLEVARELLRRRPDEAHALLTQALARGTEALTEVRRIARGLRPPTLDELGLVAAIRQFADDLGQQIRVLVKADTMPELPAAVEVAAYAIVREALTNVVRHARATASEVRLSVADRTLRVEVDDDGCGVAAAAAGPGVGMVSMRERARELGGRCTVAALPGGGTRVSAQLPLDVTEGDHGGAD
jgi:signal transduction histidine kinase